MEKLTLIIPAKNESESLPKVLQSLKEVNIFVSAFFVAAMEY